ncbi:hypothetical protein D7322_23055 [Sphingobacterium puteale]|uniref:Uncharacterized protein n=1 Tax=Sphingobacterium puteale TaxID=2420510 RepID=A0A420VS11_9SPHI|nr:hypothetical protein [Sphingobacterium puteale]RKO69120.1 hypothetical protein D7322_23055 [Sphingobacterium puteale]
MYQRLRILASPLFILFLILLLVNDFYLKGAFHNVLMGKLSDFSGLFIFPIFWSAIFPKRKALIFIATAVLFTFWKSEYSAGLIQWMNPYFGVGRTVDLSDLMTLPMIGLAWFYTKSGSQPAIRPAFMLRLSTYLIGMVAMFAFCATTQPRYIQAFEQPQYILLKHPTLKNFDPYYGFQFYKIDSLLVVKIDYLYRNRPVRNDDYNKNKNIQQLDQDVLSIIGDSATHIPVGTITQLTIHTDEWTDSLRFNGGRLDGPLIRTKGNKRIIEGFYKMGLEDATWTLRDSSSNDRVVQTFVQGEKTQVKQYSGDKLKSSSTVNTRADTIVNTYVQLAMLTLAVAAMCFLLYRNKRKAIPTGLQLSLLWKLLICFVSPLVVWLFYIGIMLLLMNYDEDIFEAIATAIFVFIAVCPLMFIIVFAIKLAKEIDVFWYCFLFALLLSIFKTYAILEALSN